MGSAAKRLFLNGYFFDVLQELSVGGCEFFLFVGGFCAFLCWIGVLSCF